MYRIITPFVKTIHFNPSHNDYSTKYIDKIVIYNIYIIQSTGGHEMVLNEQSYVHKNIRKLCSQLELLSGTKMITNLSENFTDIRFIDKYGYIIIDYKNETIITLSNKIDLTKQQIIEDIMLYCNWLEIGEKYTKNRCNKNVTFIFEKTLYKKKQNIYTQNCEEDKRSSKKTISKQLHKM